MTNRPLLSILMTAYNREKYIGVAIESVLASTYTNLELIIVDDGSKDNTVAIARSYSAKDERVKVFLNEKNLGDYPNRNQAASYATGKYIKYLDADDYIYPWGLEIAVDCMEKFPEAGYGLDSIEQDIGEPFPFLLSPQQAYYREFFTRPTFHKAPSSCIIKTEIFKAAGGFSGKWMVGDFEMWLKLSRQNSVLLMPMGMIWARVHDEQESAHIRTNSVVVFDYTVIAIENLEAADCPLEKKDKELLIARTLRSQCRSVMRSVLIERNIDAAKEKMKKARLTFFYCLRNSF